MSETPKTCDVCGEPATNTARDFIVGCDPSGSWERAKPVGGPKLGCDKHPARSIEHRTGQVISDEELP